MEKIIQCENLTHYYGSRKIYEDISFDVNKGKVVGLLGKNGVGKSTTINILMGFLKPTAGQCTIFGEDSTDLSPLSKRKIGLLYEGHVQYDFMSIEELEIFYSGHYKQQWKKDFYYNLIDKLKVPYSQKIKHLSCGQRSQVVLGLIFAQDPELLILDDYSMGLDVGYRKLFVDYLRDFVKKNNKTVLMTTHIVQDLEDMIDDIIILDNQQPLLTMEMKSFKDDFKKFTISDSSKLDDLPKNSIVSNYEGFNNDLILYSFENEDKIKEYLENEKVSYSKINSENLNFENAFLGYTGRY
ncbi:MAG: ABC transporter ATP-binding protein [Campylobacterales bacterium]|nr:ABC transporter ATP-binding protein [Campylobacterales bacterium]